MFLDTPTHWRLLTVNNFDFLPDYYFYYFAYGSTCSVCWVNLECQKINGPGSIH